MNKIFIAAFSFLLALSFVSFPGSASAALSCSVATSCANTTMMNLSTVSNAHAEIPSLSNYTQKVCCSGLVGLSNSCSNPNAKTFAKLKNTTNSHAEIGTLSNYTNSLCISSASASDIFTIGFIPSSSGTCVANGYDTALVLLEDTINAQTYEPSSANVALLAGKGIGTSVCASVSSQSITFSISDNTIGFGTLSPGSARYATGDTLGSASTVAAHTISIATNAIYGYTLNVLGPTLSSGANTVTAIGNSATTSAVGTEQFGLFASASGGIGTVSSPYGTSLNFAYGATSTIPSQVASSTTGDGVTTTYSMRYIVNISSGTEVGSYSTTLTYIATANF